MYYDLNINIPLTNLLDDRKIYDVDFTSDVVFSLKENKVVYNVDGSFNKIKIDENIFVNVSMKDLKTEMKNNLKGMIGNCYTLIESGQKIYIGKDLLGEYTYSKYTKSLNNTGKLIKGNLIVNLKDIINNCNRKQFSKNRKTKHKIDGKYGFYKYTIKFSFKLKK